MIGSREVWRSEDRSSFRSLHRKGGALREESKGSCRLAVGSWQLSVVSCQLAVGGCQLAVVSWFAMSSVLCPRNSPGQALLPGARLLILAS